ncbi:MULTISPECIES: DNA polymerase III subunit delta [unclassified Streptococcus]|uniref:DNA polymerase III subunit delta n=1 Tax=unclassified Streptococcus TaxID=2608887 RepID=UPI0015BDA178|nr:MULTISPECIES: DNA polymerase III subunit delta [unclassified Streptococcus]MCP9014800.1 DNA polymerase III subunit delta [Streptococcus sp. CF8_St5-17]QLF55714.1 DNA polymerase III subunit delta [Streptococcus sp. oral taxon 061]
MLAIEESRKLSLANLPSLTLFTGVDQGQYDIMKTQVLKQIGYDPADLNFAYFDMKEVDYKSLELELVSLPFFADEKIVILDHFVDITTAKKRYLTDDELKSFEDYLENPLPSSKLVIFAEGKLDSKRRLVKLLKRDATVFEAIEPKEQEIRAYFQEWAQELGLNFAGKSFEQLLIKSGFQFSEIQKNLLFLQAYKDNGDITEEDIVEAIPKTLQDNIFDLTQLILTKKIDQARDLVKDLTLQGEDEIKLIAIMLGQFRLYTQVKILQESGQTEAKMVSSLGHYLGRNPNPYQIRFALRDTRGLSLNFLQDSIRYLIQADYQIKTGVYEKGYLFENALLQIASQSN